MCVIWNLDAKYIPKIHKEVSISFSIIVAMTLVIHFLGNEEAKLLLNQMPSYFYWAFFLPPIASLLRFLQDPGE